MRVILRSVLQSDPILTIVELILCSYLICSQIIRRMPDASMLSYPNAAVRFAVGGGIQFFLYWMYGWRPGVLGFRTKGLWLSVRLFWPMIVMSCLLLGYYGSQKNMGVDPSGIGSASEFFRAVLVFLAIGFFEEILFRGAVVNILRIKYAGCRYEAYIVSVLSGLMFGAFHLVNLRVLPASYVFPQVLEATMIGMLFAAIYWRSGNLAVPIVMHGVYDLCAGLATGVDTIDNAMLRGISPQVVILSLALCLLTVVYLRHSVNEKSGIGIVPVSEDV